MLKLKTFHTTTLIILHKVNLRLMSISLDMVHYEWMAFIFIYIPNFAKYSYCRNIFDIIALK